MEDTHVERIRSLLAPDIPNERTRLQWQLTWDSTASVWDKLRRLYYHAGGLWWQTHEDSDERQQMIVHAFNLLQIPVRDVTFMDSDLEAPGWMNSIVTGSNNPSKHVQGYVTPVDPIAADGRFIRKTQEYGICLSIGIRHTDRSIMGKNADGLCLNFAPRMLTWKWRHDSDEHPTVVKRVDTELLVGYARVCDILEHTAGINLTHFNYHDDQQMQALDDALERIAFDENAAVLSAQHSRNQRHGTIANAFTQKIVVNKRVQALADASSLHDVFEQVEFDEDIDVDKIPQLEQEIRVAMRHVPQAYRDVTDLRVRKLGKYAGNTMGVYSPDYQAIVLDDGKATRNGFSGMSSFMHEYAHHLDHYAKIGTMLSREEEFQPLLQTVTRYIQSQHLPRSREQYLSTPTEVFARCFEYWASEIVGVHSSLLDTHDTYQTNARYEALREHKELVDATMRTLFPDFHAFDTLDTKHWDHERFETVNPLQEESNEQRETHDAPAMEPFDWQDYEQQSIFDLLDDMSDMTSTLHH